ncbi:MAG: glycosyltransferase family 2 protein [Rhodobacteraceae bacterium]|nr:glycosyltransferase family 2 protein [Paracoccaceae bacterium]
MMPQTILTIILNFRTPEMTVKSAAAAMAQMETLPGEILIIDNGSGDDSFELIRDEADSRGWLDSGRLRVLQSPRNGGFGAGMNLGMHAALSDGSLPDFYYLLNSDAFPQDNAIRILRDFLVATPKAGMAGSYIRGVDGEPHCTAFRFPSIAGEFEGAARTGVISRMFRDSVVALGIPEKTTQVDWTAGASLMLRREMIDQIGGFDETFFLYFEETDLCQRATQAGWRIYYVPESEVAHVGSASTGMKTWARTPQYWFDSRLHYFTKTHGSGYAVAATVARIAGCLIWRVRRVIQDKPQGDPARFLRDLIAHSLRALTRKTEQSDKGLSLSAPVSEDTK